MMGVRLVLLALAATLAAGCAAPVEEAAAARDAAEAAACSVVEDAQEARAERILARGGPGGESVLGGEHAVLELELPPRTVRLEVVASFEGARPASAHRIVVSVEEDDGSATVAARREEAGRETRVVMAAADLAPHLDGRATPRTFWAHAGAADGESGLAERVRLVASWRHVACA